MASQPHSLRITRHLNHDRARVFSALTDPAKMTQWFFGMKNGRSKVTNDLRPGGKYTIEMANDEMSGTSHGTYLEIVPPEKLVFTWSSDCGAAETKVTIELFERGGGTDLVLTHELPESDAPSHREGWNGCLDHLEIFLDGGAAATR